MKQAKLGMKKLCIRLQKYLRGKKWRIPLALSILSIPISLASVIIAVVRLYLQ